MTPRSYRFKIGDFHCLSVSSVLEGETQAANMGLLVFGSPVRVIFGMAFNLTGSDVLKHRSRLGRFA